MTHSNLISIDLAKSVFQVCMMDHKNQIISNRQYTRSKRVELMATLPQSTVAMEACYSSHHWARAFEQMGHNVKLIPAQHVKPFVRGNKNDANDAVAIAEASRRPNLIPVPVKTLAQQDIQSMHRIRERLIKARTALANQARGLLSEYGLMTSCGFKALKTLLLASLDNATLSVSIKEEMASLYEELRDLDERKSRIEKKLKHMADENALCQQLLTIPGIGVINATALYASIGNASQFRSSRELAVWMGLTPSQHASGQRSVMGAITQRGSRYLRKQLIHGARAYLLRASGRDDALSQWATAVRARRGAQKAAVALAHKLARIVWAVLTKDQPFQWKMA